MQLLTYTSTYTNVQTLNMNLVQGTDSFEL